MTLTTYADKSGEAWPSQATLADGTGWSRRSVNKALDELERSGWLTRLKKGHKGSSTLYRLHLLHASGAPSGLCTSREGMVHVAPSDVVVTCTPTPQGERLYESPEGGILAQPGDVPDDLWRAATPLLNQLLGTMSSEDADRFRSSWPLAKSRDFCWRLTELTGTNPEARPRPDLVIRNQTELIAALTAVPLTDVLHVGPALYSRAVRLADGQEAVPPREDPRQRVRQFYALPPGVVGEAVAGVVRSLSKTSVGDPT